MYVSYPKFSLAIITDKSSSLAMVLDVTTRAITGFEVVWTTLSMFPGIDCPPPR